MFREKIYDKSFISEFPVHKFCAFDWFSWIFCEIIFHEISRKQYSLKEFFLEGDKSEPVIYAKLK